MPLLRTVGCAVVDAGETALVPGNVVQNGLDNVRRSPELCHAGCRRPAEVMKPPRAHDSFSMAMLTSSSLLRLRPTAEGAPRDPRTRSRAPLRNTQFTS